ncbi:MAG: outer membrane beta-barrel protein [Pseudobdellovibrionaceae bacterium]
MNHLKILIILISVLFGMKTQASGLFLEPAITYETGNNDITWPAPLSTSTGTIKGLGVDLKLGVDFDSVVFIALDGSYSKVKFENSATNYSADAISTLYGLVVGGQFPIVGLRGWAGYIFNGTLDPDQSGSYDVKFEDPKGLKLGLGFKICFVSLNVEYFDIKYSKSRIEKPIAADFSSDLHNKSVIVGVSFPLAM